MTTTEMSDYFDVVLQGNTIPMDVSQIDPKLFDEYEKSVFITKTQEELVKQLYNRVGEFDTTEYNRRLLNNLVKSVGFQENKGYDGFHSKSGSQFYSVPNDVMFIVYEQCKMESDDPCISSRIFDVYPCTHDEFNVIKRNPFRGTNEHRVLRLDVGNVESKGIIELISDYKVSEYLVKYIKKPRPVVLVDLSRTDLSIDGENHVSECELDDKLHAKLVELAVVKALQSRGLTQAK